MTDATWGAHIIGARSAANAAMAALTSQTAQGIDPNVGRVSALTAQIHKVLYRQTVLIAGDRIQLSDALRSAHHRSAQVAQLIPNRTDSPDQVEQSVTDALHRLRIAADIAFSHISPDATARSPTGIALLGSVDVAPNLATVAELAVTVSQLDRQLQQAADAFTRPQDPARKLESAAQLQISRGPTGPTYLHAATAIADVTGPRAPDVTDHATFRDAINVARTWLAQTYTEGISGRHLRMFLGAGLAMSHELKHLASAFAGDWATAMRAQHGIDAWRAAQHRASAVTTLDQRGAIGPAAIVTAERWLRDHLRPNGTWTALPAVSDPETWKQTMKTIAAAMPDIATMLAAATRTAVARHAFYTAENSAETSTKITERFDWIRVARGDPAVDSLGQAIADLRPATTLLTSRLAAAEAGLHDALHRAPIGARYRTLGDDTRARDRILKALRADLQVQTHVRQVRPQPDRSAETSSALAARIREAVRDDKSLLSFSLPEARQIKADIDRLRRRVRILEVRSHRDGAVAPTAGGGASLDSPDGDSSFVSAEPEIEPG